MFFMSEKNATGLDKKENAGRRLNVWPVAIVSKIAV